MKEYKLLESTSNISVSDEQTFFTSEKEAWESLRQYLEPGQIGILYAHQKVVLPLINPGECIKTYNKKYNSKHNVLFVWEWKPLFAGRAEDKYTPTQLINITSN